MSAPARQPHYYDMLGYEQDGLKAGPELAFLIDQVASTATTFPDWISEDLGIPLRLSLISNERGVRTVLSMRAAGHEATVTFSADPTGWMLIVGEHAGREAFRAYLDRPYEMFEFWPAGAKPGPDEEGPGKVGKKIFWVGLHSTVWPALSSFANELGGVYFEIDEEKLRENGAASDA